MVTHNNFLFRAEVVFKLSRVEDGHSERGREAKNRFPWGAHTIERGTWQPWRSVQALQQLWNNKTRLSCHAQRPRKHNTVSAAALY